MSKHVEPRPVHCPDCKVPIIPNADGTIPYHTGHVNGKPSEPSDWKQKCDGVGRKAGQAA